MSFSFFLHPTRAMIFMKLMTMAVGQVRCRCNVEVSQAGTFEGFSVAGMGAGGVLNKAIAMKAEAFSCALLKSG